MIKSPRFLLIPILYIVTISVFGGNLLAMGTFDLLRQDVTPRGSALGGHPVALSYSGLDAQTANPAGLTNLQERQAMIDYADHPLDLFAGYLAYGKPIYKGYLTIAITHFNYGTFDRFITEYAENEGTFQAGDYLFAASYGYRPPFEGMYVGATVKYIHSKIESYSSQAIAVDLGWLWRTGFQGIDLGITLSNLGTQFSPFSDRRENLPAILRIGATKQLEHLPLQLTATAHLEGEENAASLFSGKYDEIFATLGGEFIVSELMKLRAGYSTLGDNYRVGNFNDRLAGLSWGIGITYHQYKFDYAFHSLGSAGYVHRVGITFKF